MSKYDFPTEFECQNRILNVKIRFSDSVRMSKYDFEYQNRIFRLSSNVKLRCQNTIFRLSSNVKIGF